MRAGASQIPDWLAARAATAPEGLALRMGDRRWSFAQLDAEASRLARQLASLGVGPGDRVATLLHNGIVAAVIPHALLRLGATLVPINVRQHRTEIARHLAHASPRVVIVQQATAPLSSSRGDTPTSSPAVLVGPDRRFCTFVTLDSAPTEGCVALASIAEADVPLRLEHPTNEVLAVIYTSGTTGRARGAMLTIGNFWWSALGSTLTLGTRADDRWVACLPLFHVGGLSILMRGVIQGFTVDVHERFDAAAVSAAIDEGATIVSLVAIMLQRLLDHRGDVPFPPSLRCLLVGGGPVPDGLLVRAARLDAPVVQTYGLTECTSQVATIAPADALRKLGSAGRALYPNELRIARSAADESTDGAGEILVRGPIVMAGYLGDPEATSRAIVDGFLHTGDVGRLDDEGFLHVLDRRDDLIVTGGENVYPAEVESALLEHPWVEEAAVVAAQDDVWGHRVVAVVRLREPADADAAAEILHAHCQERLAGYQAPSEIRFVTEPLPRTATGKLRRAAVRQEI